MKKNRFNTVNVNNLLSIRKVGANPIRWLNAHSGLLFNFGEKTKVAWPLRAATLEQQAVITQCSSKAESGKLV